MFSLVEYQDFVDFIQDEVSAFKARQAEAVVCEEARCVSELYALTGN